MRQIPPLMLIATLLTGSAGHAWGFGPQLVDPLRFNESNIIGPVVLDQTTVYCYWPKWVVRESAVSAVDLETGERRWSKPANLALPVLFRIEEGWLLYETTEGSAISENRTNGLRTLHVVNALDGAELTFPHDPQRGSSVDRPRVHRDRCVTSQGLVVSCSERKQVGDLGSGEHRTAIHDGKLFVASLILDETNTHFERHVLRRFDLGTMEIEREIDLPLEEPWRLIAAKGDLAIGRRETEQQQAELVCFDLSSHSKCWSVESPKAVRTVPNRWEGDSTLVLAMGVHGAIRPVQIDMRAGKLSPDLAWQDPRLILAWHQEGGLYPDFVAATQDLIIGRWRFVQLSCVDRQTGQLRWNQFNSDHMISRLFCCEDQVSDYLVAESPKGFDIISTATGERRSVTPGSLGLELRPQPAEANVPEGDSHVPLLGKSHDWLWDGALMFGPFIPLIIWFICRRAISNSRPRQRKYV